MAVGAEERVLTNFAHGPSGASRTARITRQEVMVMMKQTSLSSVGGSGMRDSRSPQHSLGTLGNRLSAPKSRTKRERFLPGMKFWTLGCSRGRAPHQSA
eukprot:15319737-Alexandrium_andersonii.AAC.1